MTKTFIRAEDLRRHSSVFPLQRPRPKQSSRDLILAANRSIFWRYLSDETYTAAHFGLVTHNIQQLNLADIQQSLKALVEMQSILLKEFKLHKVAPETKFPEFSLETQLK